jgi:hypothetical protein
MDALFTYQTAAEWDDDGPGPMGRQILVLAGRQRWAGTVLNVPAPAALTYDDYMWLQGRCALEGSSREAWSSAQ